MLTSWEYSLEKEALRLLHTTRQIANGFYKLNGFLVLPFPSSESNGKIVTLPDLPYLSIPRIWEKSARINAKKLPSNDHEIDEELVNEAKSLLKNSPLISPDFTDIKKTWSQNETQILNCIYSLIPSKKDSIRSIHIWPTSFGTESSFNLLSENDQNVYIWLRQDNSLAAIIEALLSSITRDDVYNELGGIWQESELLVDWLISYSPLNDLLKNIDPNWQSALTIKHTRSKQNGVLVQKSQEFLKKIGAPTINPTNITQINFSPREKQIIDLMVSASPKPISCDQIGDILFESNPDGYSLFAISKAIQRLRDKLEQNGISGSFIQTKRGEGYLLSA